MYKPIYTVGGTVQAGGGVYIDRPADTLLLEHCRNGEYAYVLTPRQMGKSSLMVRTADTLAAEGFRVAQIDLTRIGVQLTAEQWYLGLLTEIEEQLELEMDAVAWWQARGHLGYAHRMSAFFEGLLAEVPERVAIFIDEIDTTLSLEFTDDFFGAIRHLFNRRSAEPAYRRLSFVLIGVAMPGDLIKDAHRTPFNVARGVDLTDFTLDEALPLAGGFGLGEPAARQVLAWILDWTGGHPFLTLRLCRAAAELERENWTQEQVAALAREIFLGGRSIRDNNLQFVRDMLTQRAGERCLEVLTLYGRVLKGGVVDQKQSWVHSHLKLSGVVRARNDQLEVRNRIYRELFDHVWVKQNLPQNWRHRLDQIYRVAVTAAATFFILLVPITWRACTANNHAVTRLLGAQAALTQNREADLLPRSALLAIESLRRGHTIEAYQPLHSALSLLASKVTPVFHEDAVYEAAFSPDESMLATGSGSYVSAWTVPGGEERLRQWHAGTFHALAWLDNGLLGVLSSSAGREVGIDVWQVARNSKLVLTSPYKGTVTAAAFSADGLHLAAGVDSEGGSRLLLIWDLTEAGARETIRALPAASHPSRVNALAFSPDARLLATAGGDARVRVWETATGVLASDAFSADGSVNTVAFNAEGTLLAAGGDDGTARVWRLASRDLLAEARHREPVVAVGFDPHVEGGPGATAWRLATGSTDGNVRVWETLPDASASTRYVEAGDYWHESAVTSLAFGYPKGYAVLASTSTDDTARLWGLRSGGEVARMVHERDVMSIRFNRDSSLVATSSLDSVTWLWRTRDPEVLGHILAPFPDGRRRDPNAAGSGTLVALDRSGDRLAVALGVEGLNLGEPLVYVRVRAREEEDAVLEPLEGSLRDIALSANGQLVAAGVEREGRTVVQVQGRDGSGRARFEHAGRLEKLRFSRDARFLASATSDGCIRIFETAGPGVPAGAVGLSPRDVQAGGIRALDFSVDGRALAVAAGTRIVIAPDWRSDWTWRQARETCGAPPDLWPPGSPPAEPRGGRVHLVHGQVVNSVRFDHSGEWIASASNDNTLRVWAWRGRSEAFRRIEHDSDVLATDFSPDGTYLLSLSSDTLRVWSLAGDELARIRNVDPQTPPRFSATGELVYVGSDHQVRRAAWRVRDLIETACTHKLTRNFAHEEWPRDMPNGFRRTCEEIPSLYPAWVFAKFKEAETYHDAGDARQARLALSQLTQAFLSERGNLSAEESRKYVPLKNTVCWRGSLHGYARLVLPLCESAVHDDPLNGNLWDSLGVAQALSGQTGAAGFSFSRYLEWAEGKHPEEIIDKRRRWRLSLIAGENPLLPFTPELRNELLSE